MKFELYRQLSICDQIEDVDKVTNNITDRVCRPFCVFTVLLDYICVILMQKVSDLMQYINKIVPCHEICNTQVIRLLWQLVSME